MKSKIQYCLASAAALILLGGVLPCSAVLRAAPATAPAQRSDAPEQRPGAFFERIRQNLDDLKLSDEQKRKIDSIVEKGRQDFRGMVNDLRQSDPQTRRQKIRDLLDGVHDQIKSTLNSEQAQQFEQKLQQLRQDVAGAARGALRQGGMLERLDQAIKQLDLTDDQKAQIKSLFDQTRTKFQQIREEAQGNMQALREKIQPLMQDMRQQLMSILTPQQQEKLRELMRAGEREGQSPPGTQPSSNAKDPKARNSAAPPPEGGAALAPATAPSAAPLLDVRQKAPDFDLKKLDGQNVQLSSLKGRIVLLVFGSYSSPSFRQRAPSLEQMVRQYGPRIRPFVIYTRENYPSGGWEVDRNKDEGVSLSQPATLEARIAQARQAREALKLTAPILIDSIDDQAATSYGGGASNAAYLVGRDGTILARQKWFEPYAMRRAIDDALKPAMDRVE